MYIDYIKQDYSDKEVKEREKYIERDKRCLGFIIQENIANDIENIVNRYYELDDIGCIDIDERFLEILKESEQLYYMGNFVGCIATIGIIAEEYCKYLIKINNLYDTEEQYERIKFLASKKIISKKEKDALHKIRIIRNKCIHFNSEFKKLEENELKEQAIKMIKMFKDCIKVWAVNSVKTEKVVDEFCKSRDEGIKAFVYRNRNIFKKQKGIDVQIAPGVDRLIFTSYYYIAEVDIAGNDFKEMTLVDLGRGGIPVVVDLAIPQAEMIDRMKIQAGNIVLATLISRVSETGMTEEWQLLSVLDVYHEAISLDELDTVMRNF